MKKMKRIMAWIGIIVLVGLYLVTFILGIFGNEATKGMLMASIACTVVIPCLMYGMMLVVKVLGDKNAPKNENPPSLSSNKNGKGFK